MKILIAEDDTSIAMIAKLSLERLGGHTVVHAADGEQALTQALQQSFDLILLDGMMPKYDGLTVCKTLRQNHQIQTPIIFLSAKSQECEIKLATEAGATGYILKPFDPKFLNSQIEEILDSKLAHRAPAGAA
jgi:two-component system alkaline phosphatase synthesis response regulator PhoP